MLNRRWHREPIWQNWTMATILSSWAWYAKGASRPKLRVRRVTESGQGGSAPPFKPGWHVFFIAHVAGA